MSKGKVIAIVAQKGGTGKSAAAAHLSHGLTYRDKKVLVLDTDKKSTIKNGFDARMGYKDMDLIEESTAHHYPMVRKMSPHDPVELILDKAREKYDYIFIDTPGKLETFEAEMISRADVVLMVVGASDVEFKESYDVVKVANSIAERYGKKIPTIGMLQRVDPRDKYLNEYIRDLVLEDADGLESAMSNNSIIKILEGPGFTAYDALHYPSLMTKILKIEWKRDRVSTISKKRAQDTVDEVESVLNELLLRIESYE